MSAPILFRTEVREPNTGNAAVCCVRPLEGSSEYEVFWDGGFCSNGEEALVCPDIGTALAAMAKEVDLLARDWYEGAGY